MINNKTGKKFFSIFLILAMLLNMNLSVMAQTKLDSEILPVLTEEGQSDTLQTGVDNEDNSELTEQESSDEILPETDNENNFYEMELEPSDIIQPEDDNMEETPGLVLDTLQTEIESEDFIVTEYGQLTEYNGDDTVVAIPSEISGITITSISNSAFQGNTKITKVTIPNTVTEIEPGIKTTVNWVDKYDSAFSGCTNLKEVVFENGGKNPLKVGNYTFTAVSNLEKVVFSTTRKTSLGESVFEKCTALKDVNFEESKLKSIGKLCFAQTDLESVTLPNTLEIISEGSNGMTSGAFGGCLKLNEVYFAPGGNERLVLGAGTFYNLTNLSKIELPKDRPVSFGDGNNGISVFQNCGITEIDLTGQVEKLGLRAFNGCKKLVSVKLGENITDIPNFAFSDCPELISINLENIKSIGANSFQNSNKLSEISEDNILSVIEEIGASAFANTGIGKITIYNKDAKINLNSFTGSSSIIIYGWIGSDAQACGTNENVIFVALDETGESNFVFDKDSGRIIAYTGTSQEVEIPAQIDGVDVVSLSGYAFVSNSDLRFVDIKAPLKEIEAYTFSRYKQLSIVLLPETISSIGDYAFSDSGIETIEIPAATTVIGERAFNNCSVLKDIKFNEGLKDIESYAFNNCTSLEEINLPSSMENIGNYALCNTGLYEFTVPEKITQLPSNMLTKSANLKKVSFAGNSVTTIGANAFSNCTSLTEFIVPDSVTEIKNSVFSNDTALQSLVVPSTVVTLGNNVVQNTKPEKVYVYVEKDSEADKSTKAFPSNYCTKQYSFVAIEALSFGVKEGYENKALNVNKNDAEKYGFSDDVTNYQVSVLDAIIAVHAEKYDWAGECGDEITIVDNKVTCILGIDTESAGFTLNGSPFPINDAASTLLRDGDKLLIFTGLSESGTEQGIAWFEFDGKECRELRVAPEREYVVTITSSKGPVANVPIHIINEADGGKPVGEPLGITNENGEAVIRFTDAGVKIIAGVDENYFFSRMTVTVYEPDITLKSLSIIGTPAFDTMSELSNGHIAGQLIQVYDGKEKEPGFDCKHSEYNVYTNSNTESINLMPVLNSMENAELKKLSFEVDGKIVEGLIPNNSGGYVLPAVTVNQNNKIQIVLKFEENGQTFNQVYSIHVIKDFGDMSTFYKMLKIRGAGTTGVATSTAASDLEKLPLYYDQGDTKAAIDVFAEEGVVLKLDGEVLTNGSSPIKVNGRSITTYRVEFPDFNQVYKLETYDDNDTIAQEITVESFTRRTNIEGVHAPNSVSDWGLAPGQYTSSGIGKMTVPLLPTTAWSKYISLGEFGGYYEVYYEEPIKNDPRNPYGIDFIVYGNNFGGAPEPAGVQVSEDGIHWYDLAGQRHYELSTYYDNAVLLDGRTIESVLIARDGQNGYPGGYPTKIQFGYVDVARCSEIPNAEPTYYVSAKAYNPYIKTYSSNIGDGFDLSWAVDRDGKPSELKNGIHYIRMQNVADIKVNGAMGEVSPEIGTITRINPSTLSGDVGITAEPEKLTVNGKSFADFTGKTVTNNGRTIYYELDLKKTGPALDVYVKGAEDDNIFVNMESYYGGEAKYTGLTDEFNNRTIRILVQNGKKEPIVYIIKCTDGGEAAKIAELESIKMEPGDVILPVKDGVYSATVKNNIEQIRLTVSALNHQASIQLDGHEIIHNEATSNIPLEVGSNTYKVTVTSKDGTVSKEYTIVIIREEDDKVDPSNNMIKVKFRFTGDDIHYIQNSGDKYKPGQYTGPHNPKDWISRVTVEVPKNSTVKYLTDMMLMNNGIDFHAVGGTYIDKVQIPGTNKYLGEFDNGPNSGWMYRHNSYIADVGYASRILEDGDSVEWFYTDDYTKETGYENWSPAWDVNNSDNGENQILNPKAKVDEKGEARATLTEKELSEVISNIGESKGVEIIIKPEIKGDPSKVSIELPKTSVKDIAKKTDASLRVSTIFGTLLIPNDILSSIASQSAGNKVVITVEKKTADTLKDKMDVYDTENAVIVEITIISDDKAITEFDEKALTVLIPVDNNKFIADTEYTVFVISTDGSVEKVIGKCLLVEDELMVQVKTAHLSTFVVTTKKAGKTAMPFIDIDGHWAKDAIQYVYENGLMTGVSDTQFDPDGSLSRGMLVTILYRMEGKPGIKSKNTFTDIPAEQWYTDAVIWANESGIVTGYGEGIFGANDSITREQIAAILYRYAKLKEYDISETTELTVYTDAASTSSWAKQAMKWAVSRELIAGTSSTTLSPSGTATRAQIATILMRYIENVNRVGGN